MGSAPPPATPTPLQDPSKMSIKELGYNWKWPHYEIENLESLWLVPWRTHDSQWEAGLYYICYNTSYVCFFTVQALKLREETDKEEEKEKELVYECIEELGENFFLSSSFSICLVWVVSSQCTDIICFGLFICILCFWQQLKPKNKLVI